MPLDRRQTVGNFYSYIVRIDAVKVPKTAVIASIESSPYLFIFLGKKMKFKKNIVVSKTQTQLIYLAVLSSLLVPNVQAADYIWTGAPLIDSKYSEIGLPLTITSGDQLLTSTNYFKIFDNVVVFTNNGTVAQSDSNLYLGNTAQINNGGTWKLQGNIGISHNNGGTFTNTGTLAKTAGTGTSTITAGVDFSNSGILDAQIGTIEYLDTPTFNSGTTFSGTGLHLLNNGAVFNSDFSFNNNLQFNSGSFKSTVTEGITLNSNLLWTGGRLFGSWINAAGKILTANTTSLKQFDTTAIFTNNGTVAQSDRDISLGNNAQINNAGTWNLQGDIGIAHNNGGTFTNTGTLAKTAGTGTSTITAGVDFFNSGILDAQVGTIEYLDTPVFNSGTVFSGAGLHLLSHGATFNSDFAFNNNLQFGGGVFHAVPAEGVTLNSDLLWTGDSLANNTLSGTWINATGRKFTVSSTSLKSFDTGAVFTNNGTLSQSDRSINLGNGSNITNAGIWKLQGDVGLAASSGLRTFNNTGTLAKTEGPGISSIGSGVEVKNTGLIDVQIGTLSLASNFTNQGIINVDDGATFAVSATTFTNASGGLLQGNGTFDPSDTNDLINQGKIAPGKNGIGNLNIAGDFSQTSTGLLDIEIGGTINNFDTLTISGNATFGGTLKLDRLGVFNPQIGDVFTLILFGGNGTGTFTSLDTSAFSGLNFAAIYNAHNVQLQVTSAVPVPAAVWLFASGLLGMFSIKRRYVLR